MTKKQESILNAALVLFADKGYHAVPTSLIAKQAGVSEGLIFRHFKNKFGLLSTIIQLGKEKLAEILEPIREMEEPGKQMQAIMEIPFHIAKEDYPLWQLVYSLKWQEGLYNDELADEVKGLIAEVLKKMKYTDVDLEAELVMCYIDGFATSLLLRKDDLDKDALLKVLRKKYAISK